MIGCSFLALETGNKRIKAKKTWGKGIDYPRYTEIFSCVGWVKFNEYWIEILIRVYCKLLSNMYFHLSNFHIKAHLFDKSLKPNPISPFLYWNFL